MAIARRFVLTNASRAKNKTDQRWKSGKRFQSTWKQSWPQPGEMICRTRSSSSKDIISMND